MHQQTVPGQLQDKTSQNYGSYQLHVNSTEQKNQ